MIKNSRILNIETDYVKMSEGRYLHKCIIEIQSGFFSKNKSNKFDLYKSNGLDLLLADKTEISVIKDMIDLGFSIIKKKRNKLCLFLIGDCIDIFKDRVAIEHEKEKNKTSGNDVLKLSEEVAEDIAQTIFSHAYTNSGVEDLTKAEVELLQILSEECAEIQQAISKILRFGPYSYNPEDPKKTENWNRLVHELEDFNIIKNKLKDTTWLNTGLPASEINDMKIRKNKYLQYNNLETY